MNAESILGVITKGLTVVGSLVEAGIEAGPVISKLISVTQNGTSVTQEELDALERDLDAKLLELEGPIED